MTTNIHDAINLEGGKVALEGGGLGLQSSCPLLSAESGWERMVKGGAITSYLEAKTGEKMGSGPQYPLQEHASGISLPPPRPHLLSLHKLPVMAQAGEQYNKVWACQGH